jgi:hypothetical protein
MQSEKQIEAAARADAAHAGRTFDALSSADKTRFMERAHLMLEAALSTDAEPVKTAPAVAVKALEWQSRGRKNGDTYANSFVGQYSVGDIWGEIKSFLRTIVDGQDDDQVLGVHGSLEEAKAVAQSDYESRIRASLTAQVQDVAGAETLETYYGRQIEWSRETFGPALRTKGIIDHIKKELREIEADPHDLSEWVDVVILAMDGFWRHGGNASDLFSALLAKQKKNMARTWPDWRAMSEDTAIEHDRSKDEVSP